MFILKRLRRVLLVSVDSKDVYAEIRHLADGSPVAGLGRSMLRPYVCSQIKRRERSVDTRSLDRGADMDVAAIKGSSCKRISLRGGRTTERK